MLNDASSIAQLLQEMVEHQQANPQQGQGQLIGEDHFIQVDKGHGNQ